MAPTVSASNSTLSSDDSGNLTEISWQLEPRTGKIPLAGRCHRLPKKLEADYQLTTKVLGTGYNGSVRMASSRTNGKQTVAVKTFKLKGLRGCKKDRLMSEIAVFLCMDHPHVARLLDVYESDHHISLVTECIEGGELFDRVTKMKRFSEPGAADATRQMLLALHYLHSHGMVHRDLKLENFLYDDHEGSHLKMIDFGFSKFFNAKTRMKTSCGTLAYVSPEVLRRSYTSQCDLWSMGVIVFILLSGHMPFHGDSEEQMKSIKKGKYSWKPEHWSNVSKVGQEFVKALLELDPSKRLTAKTALEHQWLSRSFKSATPSVDASIVYALSAWTSAPKLQRACTSMMAWSLTNRHHAQVRDHFLALDKNHDGAICFQELKEALDVAGVTYSEAENDAYHVFTQLAHGHGFEIHYSDFLAAMVCCHLDLDEQLLQTTFQKFDRHGSGFITANGLKEVLGCSFIGEDVEALLCEADPKGAGRLDYTEFADYLHSGRARLVAERNTALASKSSRLRPAAKIGIAGHRMQSHEFQQVQSGGTYQSWPPPKGIDHSYHSCCSIQ